MTTNTDNLLRSIAHVDFFDDGLVAGSGTWRKHWASQCGDARVAARAITAALRAELLVLGGDDDGDTWVSLTAVGAERANHLKNDEGSFVDFVSTTTPATCDTTAHTHGSHTECYANKAHAKSPKGRAACRARRA